jgi:hypothetical protein
MSSPKTYEEHFTSWLEEEIAQGGDVSRQVMLVNSYQGADSTARYRLFLEWLQGAALSCHRCKTSFKPGLEDVREDDDVLCVDCRLSWLRSDEPVPGYRRTFGVR